MMRPRRLLALLFVLIIFLSSCSSGIGEVTTEEPVISASVTEFIPPETEEETVAAVTEEETTEHEIVMADLPPDLILKISEKLVSIYRSYTCTSRTVTEIDLKGEKSRSEIASELKVSGGNAQFVRTDKDGTEEFYLIDGFLCYSGKCGKYRLGGYDITLFSELIGDFFPLSAFKDGKKELDGDDIILTFDSITDAGKTSILAMLGLPDDYSVNVTDASLTVRTDPDGHQKHKEMLLGITVSKDGEDVMTLTLSSVSEQKDIGVPTVLEIPAASEFTLFPGREALLLYESLTEAAHSVLTDNKAFEFSEKDNISISSRSLDLTLTSKTDYAYAETIGASIEQNFDLGDGTGKHSVLTHFNKRYGFSQIDGGSIFVDKTINAANLFFTLSHPFETCLLPLSDCAELLSVKNGRITFSLNNKAIENIARDILLRAGITDADIKISKTDTAGFYLAYDQSGSITSFGYDLSARVIINSTEHTLSRSHSIDITSRGSAKVKVIYIEVDEEDEEE